MQHHIDITRVGQRVGHCGPASLEMALSVVGVRRSQDVIAAATGVAGDILTEGTRIDQLENAISDLRPDIVLAAKYEATIEDVEYVIGELRRPVIVEWQGRFRHRDGSEFDLGHYSLIAGVDRLRGVLGIVDPDDWSVYRNGWIGIGTFIERWWEVNDFPGDDGEVVKLRTERLAFLVATAADADSLHDRGFRLNTRELSIAHGLPADEAPFNAGFSRPSPPTLRGQPMAAPEHRQGREPPDIPIAPGD